MSILRKLVNKVLGVDVRLIKSTLNEVAYNLSLLSREIGNVKSRVIDIDDRTIKDHELIKSSRDGIADLREKLYNVRGTTEYKKTLDNNKPLVSVCIPTYNNGRALVEIALKSVLSQTYQNIEVIIIGDACTDDTEERISQLKDDRITFINLPNRGPYPDDKNKRWMVAGAPGVDLAAMLSKGDWIARLDDDDYWTDDHIEKLLGLALDTKSEFVYGALERKNVITNKSHILYNAVPSFGQISFQGVMYMRRLNFFHYDQQSFLVEEPTDWNLVKRMINSGVYYASTSDVVGVINWTPNTSGSHR